jgi:hypothetical protein
MTTKAFHILPGKNYAIDAPAPMGCNPTIHCPLNDCERARVSTRGEHPIAPAKELADTGAMQIENRINSFGIAGAVIGCLLGLGFGYWCVYLPSLGSPMISGLILGWGFTGISGALTVGGLSALMAGMYYFGKTNERILHSRAALELTLGTVK